MVVFALSWLCVFVVTVVCECCRRRCLLLFVVCWLLVCRWLLFVCRFMCVRVVAVVACCLLLLFNDCCLLFAV